MILWVNMYITYKIRLKTWKSADSVNSNHVYKFDKNYKIYWLSLSSSQLTVPTPQPFLSPFPFPLCLLPKSHILNLNRLTTSTPSFKLDDIRIDSKERIDDHNRERLEDGLWFRDIKRSWGWWGKGGCGMWVRFKAYKNSMERAKEECFDAPLQD